MAVFPLESVTRVVTRSRYCKVSTVPVTPEENTKIRGSGKIPTEYFNELNRTRETRSGDKKAGTLLQNGTATSLGASIFYTVLESEIQ